MAVKPLLFLFASMLVLTLRVSSKEEELSLARPIYAKDMVAAPVASPVKPPTPTTPRVPAAPPTPVTPVVHPPPRPPIKPPPPYPAPGPPKARLDCTPLCGERCKLHSRIRLCVRACTTCCERCQCVPPGTYGNREKCGKCYTDMTTHGGKRKCP